MFWWGLAAWVALAGLVYLLLLSSAVLGQTLEPIGRVDDWQDVLSPPYEVVDVGQLYYVPDGPDDPHKRPYRTWVEGGDCEDWAIAEYHRRRATGETGVWMVIGWDPGLNDWHAVVWAEGRLFDPQDAPMHPGFRPAFFVDETQAYRVTQ